ncbi:MAG: 2,3-epoxybenzoyl-CoA dihydrolase [Planctomycetota bacterium]
MIRFQTHPDRYRHWTLTVEGDVAKLAMNVEPFGGLRGDDYELKLNSYDLSVDIELSDAIQRLRFEHPGVRSVVVTGALDRVFCAGANIVMLRSSAHAFKVNFCKFTNETRLGIEDASENSNKTFIAALNGTASGGGYELALACDRILLVDDRNSAVSFPEVPLLGVLPGTGGLTRITDKRMVRRDRCDVFSSIAEGIKGKRAVEWDLVDAISPLSKWDELVASEARTAADAREDRSGETGVALDPIEPTIEGSSWAYRHVRMELDEGQRTATVTITAPDACPTSEADAYAEGADWWLFRAFRELDDVLLHLRTNLRDIALVLVHAEGSAETVRSTDGLVAGSSHWFVNEVKHFVKRTLKRMDLTAKSFYAIAGEGSSFTGTFLELALSSDRVYVLDDPDIPVEVGVTAANAGMFPMSNGISRLETRFLKDPGQVARVLEHMRQIPADEANELGLATFAPDDIDWEDELRLAIEERASFSPDALTGMEANLRFAGPETMETKIFGRLTAWQNWIFQRPNAVGERGALSCYGTPNRPEFSVERT